MTRFNVANNSLLRSKEMKAKFVTTCLFVVSVLFPTSCFSMEQVKYFKWLANLNSDPLGDLENQEPYAAFINTNMVVSVTWYGFDEPVLVSPSTQLTGPDLIAMKAVHSLIHGDKPTFLTLAENAPNSETNYMTARENFLEHYEHGDSEIYLNGYFCIGNARLYTYSHAGGENCPYCDIYLQYHNAQWRLMGNPVDLSAQDIMLHDATGRKSFTSVDTFSPHITISNSATACQSPIKFQIPGTVITKGGGLMEDTKVVRPRNNAPEVLPESAAGIVEFIRETLLLVNSIESSNFSPETDVAYLGFLERLTGPERHRMKNWLSKPENNGANLWFLQSSMNYVELVYIVQLSPVYYVFYARGKIFDNAGMLSTSQISNTDVFRFFTVIENGTTFRIERMPTYEIAKDILAYPASLFHHSEFQSGLRQLIVNSVDN